MDSITADAPSIGRARPWVAEYPPGVPAQIDIDPRLTLVDVLDEAFKRYAHRAACTCMGSTLTFASSIGCRRISRPGCSTRGCRRALASR